MKAFNRGVKLAGEQAIIGGNNIKVLEYDVNNHVLKASGTTVPTAASAGFAKGCIFIDTDAATGYGSRYENIGTNLSCTFRLIGNPTTAAVTASTDGSGTGVVPAGTTFATITSAGATKVVTLPVATTANIGKTLDLYVGANGYELITGADAQTISTVDSDGTNQLDVAANSLLRLIQISATGWYAYQVTATTITVVAPDND